MKCPICGHWVEDDDYWCNGICLRCALEREQQQQKENDAHEPGFQISDIFVDAESDDLTVIGKAWKNSSMRN